MDIMGDKTIRDLLHEKCDVHGDKEFLLFEDINQVEHVLTYSQFLDRVNRFSNVLLSFGIEKGDKVTLHLPNSNDFIVSWFALATIGAVMVPTNILSTAKEMEYYLSHSESLLLITEEPYLEKFSNIQTKVPKLQNILLTRCETDHDQAHNLDALIQEVEGNTPDITLNGADVAAILYTSGTTSLPKGCLITHTNYLHTGEVVSKTIRFSPEDRALIVLPLFHGNGQYYLLMPALTVGASVAITERFSASQYIKQAKRLKATIGSLFAAPIRMILAQNYDEEDKINLLRVVIFAQSVTEEELASFEDKFQVPLLQLYGMTETIAPPLMNPLDGYKDNMSIGKPTITSEVKIVDDQGDEVPRGDVGQIVVKGTPGRTIMKGYFKNEEETNNMIQNGWLNSEDSARIGENGLLYFVDRSKDMLKRAGENISTGEVENAIMEHPDVYEAAVIGVPDPIRDEAIVAFVILKKNRSSTEEEIIKHCQKVLSKFKVPDKIEFVDDFPRTSVGKIQKHQLSKD